MEVISGPCDFSEPNHGPVKLVHVEMYYILRAGTSCPYDSGIQNVIPRPLGWLIPSQRVSPFARRCPRSPLA